MRHSIAGFARRLVASWGVLLTASGVAAAQSPRADVAAVASRRVAPAPTVVPSLSLLAAHAPRTLLADSTHRAMMPGIGLVVGAVFGGVVGGVMSHATCEGSSRCNAWRDAGGGALVGGAIGLGVELMVRWVRNDPARKKSGG